MGYHANFQLGAGIGAQVLTLVQKALQPLSTSPPSYVYLANKLLVITLIQHLSQTCYC